jgi:thiamine transport system substrate-binding protein
MKKFALLVAAVAVLTGCQTSDNTLVRLAAHDSFVMSDELIAQFQSETGFEVEILRLGDTGSLTNQLILTRNAPVADAVFGIDNTFLGKAQQEGIFDSDPTAIDYSDVCFNFDIAWFDAENITPPSSWRDLTSEEYRGLTVVTNPNFSSPGLAFLATTHAGFDTPADVFAYWRDLRDNDVKVAGSWEDAYFSDFTRYGGDRPVVLSYASSPSAEVNEDGTPGSASLLTECFRQTEFAGVVAGSANIPGAKALVEFLLGDDFQRSVPEAMYVYPAVAGTDIPEAWAKFATPATSTIGDTLDIDGNRDQWLTDWSDIFG